MGEGGGILSKLSERTARLKHQGQKQEQKTLKKVEKSSWQGLEDVVGYETVAAATPTRRARFEREKSFEKNLKKALDKGLRVW